MHDSVRAWVAARVAAYDLRSHPVLEVGSLDENGSVRDLFSGSYTGVDMREGPGVDQVMDAHALDFPDASVDVLVCTEMLEHDDEFWRSLAEMGRVLKPDGHLLLTTRGNGFREHAYPSDYWRFMPESGTLLAALAQCRPIAVDPDPHAPGLFLHGVRT